MTYFCEQLLLDMALLGKLIQQIDVYFQPFMHLHRFFHYFLPRAFFWAFMRLCRIRHKQILLYTDYNVISYQPFSCWWLKMPQSHGLLHDALALPVNTQHLISGPTDFGRPLRNSLGKRRTYLTSLYQLFYSAVGWCFISI